MCPYLLYEGKRGGGNIAPFILKLSTKVDVDDQLCTPANLNPGLYPRYQLNGPGEGEGTIEET